MAYPEPTASEVDAALTVLNSVRAARQAGIKIVRKQWMQRKAGKQELARACALGAYAYVKLGMVTRSSRIITIVADNLNVPTAWVNGFVESFDNGTVDRAELNNLFDHQTPETKELHRAFMVGRNHAVAINRALKDGQL